MITARQAPDVQLVLDLLRERMGLAFPPNRRGEAVSAIRRRMAAAGVTDASAYIALLETDRRVLNDLVSECTIGETYFFREPEQLDYIRREVIPEIGARRTTGPIRAWSAGCAAGEEAYSLSILFQEAALGDRAVVVGSDAARSRLARARQGRYTRWSLRGVPAPVVQRYFSRRGKEYQLSADVRASVRFGYLNLAGAAYPSTASGIWEVDLLLCRNVLIYFDRDALPAIAERLFRTLAPGGWLFLGASDPSLSALAPFETVSTDRGIAYRRPPTRGSVAVSVSQRVEPTRLSEAPAAEPPRARPTTAAPRRSTSGGQSGNAPRPRKTNADTPARTTTPPATIAGPSAEAAESIRALANRGQLAEAGLACAAALERDSTSPDLLYLHSVLLAQAGHYREAATAARRALYVQGDLAVAHMVLGSVLVRLNDRDGARRAFRNAVRVLQGSDPAESVPGSGGEPAGQLLDLARAQLELLEAS